MLRLGQEGSEAHGFRPVALDDDAGETSLRDQPLRNPHPLHIELVRAVRVFAQEHDPRIADFPEQLVVVGRGAGQRLGDPPDRVRQSRVAEDGGIVTRRRGRRQGKEYDALEYRGDAR